MKRKITNLVFALALALGITLAAAAPAMASVTVMMAGGGNAIPANTVTYTPVGNIGINEGGKGDFGTAGSPYNLVLHAPAGFEFKTSGVTTTVAGDTGGQNVVVGTISYTTTTITLPLTINQTNKTDNLTIIGVNVRPTAGNPLANGNITSSCTGTISGLPNGTNLGTLHEVAGPLDHFAISAISSPQTAGTAITGITLTAQDVYNNTVTGFTGTVAYSGTAGITGNSASFLAGLRTGVSITPTSAGAGKTFIVTNTGKSGTATFTINPGAASAAVSTLTPTSASIPANGSSTQILTVTAKDAYGNNLVAGGSSVTITKLLGNGTISPVTDNANGTYTTSVTSPSSADSGVFVATLGGVTVKSGTGLQTQSTVTYTAVTYTITATAGIHGSISPSGAVSVNHGSNQAFNISADTGYHILDVLVDGGSVGVVASYTFNNVVANRTISASFAINAYTLTYTAGAHGSITGTASQPVNYGGSGTAVTAVPDTGYHFVNWSDSSTANPRTDTSVTANINVTANFAINTYTLTYTAGAHGSITGTASQPVNYGGSGTAVTAVANTGYHFVNWSDSSTANPRTDTSVTANINVTANFAINTYTLTYTAGAHGSITGTASQPVNYGGSGTAVTAVANTGYHFVNWNDSSTANPRTDTSVAANINVTANFAIDIYTITATAAANGSISPSGAVPVNYNDGQTFTITPGFGYTISDVLVDSVSVGTPASYTFSNVTAPHSIHVVFSATGAPAFVSAVSSIDGSMITITFSKAMVNPAGKHGEFSYQINGGPFQPFSAAYLNGNTTKIDLTTSGLAFTGEDTVTLNYTAGTVLADDGGVLATFSGQPVTNNVPATAPAAVSAATNSVGNIITITFSKAMADPSGKHGQFSYQINSGADQPFSAAALDTNTSKINLTVSGAAIAFGNTVTVKYTAGTVIAADSGVLASFSGLAVTNNISAPLAINANADSGGTISPSGAVPVAYGGSQTFNINVNSGYFISNVMVDGVSQGAVATLNFTNVTAGHTIYATFYTTSVSGQTGNVNVSSGQSGYVVNGSGGSQTTVTVNTGASPTDINIVHYSGNPHPEATLPANLVPRFNDVIVGDANAVIWPLHVELSYTPAEVSGLVETALQLYYFKNGAWQVCSSTGVNTTSKFVWANMTEAEAAGSPIIIVGPPLSGPSGPTTVGGAVYRIDKLQILMPWLMLAIFLALSAACGTGYLVKKIRHIN